jgi:cytochrome oxidase assembly protein ShyY1
MLKIRFWPALVVIVVALLTTALGFWQRGRAHEKEARQARIEQYAQASALVLGAQSVPLETIEYHKVRARGRFLPALTVYLDNRPYQDQPGFYVITPLQLDSGAVVLVNRGWLPRNSVDRTVIAPYRTPTEPVELTGIARADATRAFELGHDGSAPHLKIRQNLAIDAYARETGLPLQPFVLEQTSDDGDGLGRDWPAPSTGVERNYGYMLQWWGMALAVIVFGLYAAYRAARMQRLNQSD